MLQKATTYATYFIAVSLIYYVTFWWHFDVNVLPFFSPQNFLQGVIYPLRYAGVYLVGFAVALPLLVTIVEKIEDARERKGNVQQVEDNSPGSIREAKERKWYSGKNLVSVFTTVWPLIMIVTYLAFFPTDKIYSILAAGSFASTGWDLYHHSKLRTKNLLGLTSPDWSWVFVADTALVVFLIFLPISAFTTAFTEAQSIKRGVRFDYITAKDFKASKDSIDAPYIIYLGPVGEKFIFVSRAGDEKFVIDKSSLPIVRVHSFDKSDTASVAMFKRLTAPKKSKQKLLLSAKRTTPATTASDTTVKQIKKQRSTEPKASGALQKDTN